MARDEEELVALRQKLGHMTFTNLCIAKLFLILSRSKFEQTPVLWKYGRDKSAQSEMLPRHSQ